MNYEPISFALYNMLNDIPDPRKARGIRYKYSDLLFMAIHGILCGYCCGLDISYFVELNLDYFRKLLGIKCAPSHDTFSRIVRITDFDALSTVLKEWLCAHYPELYTLYNGKKVLHIDGKAVKAATAKSEGQNPIYMLNAMYEGGSISLYTKQIGDKENECGQIVDFLSKLDIQNTIVTIDAAGTTEPVLNYISDKGGHYLVPVKTNQKRLHAAIEAHVNKLEKSDKFNALDHASFESTAHGRTESVKTTMISNTAFIFEQLGLDSFFGTIARVGVMDKTVTQRKDGKDQTTFKRTYLITNLEEMSVENMQSIKLSHWNIEMQHWVLDVQLNEDRDTARKENAIKNNTILRRFCMNIKNRVEEYKKLSITRFNMTNMHSIEKLTEMLFKEPESNSQA